MVWSPITPASSPAWTGIVPTAINTWTLLQPAQSPGWTPIAA